MKVPTLATAPKTPAQREVAPKPSQVSKGRSIVEYGKGLSAGGGLVVLLWAFSGKVAQAWHDGWVWAFSWFGL